MAGAVVEVYIIVSHKNNLPYATTCMQRYAKMHTHADRKWMWQPYIVSMKPPSGHVDKLQSVIFAHDFSVAQYIQLDMKKKRKTLS